GKVFPKPIDESLVRGREVGLGISRRLSFIVHQFRFKNTIHLNTINSSESPPRLQASQFRPAEHWHRVDSIQDASSERFSCNHHLETTGHSRHKAHSSL